MIDSLDRTCESLYTDRQSGTSLRIRDNRRALGDWSARIRPVYKEVKPPSYRDGSGGMVDMENAVRAMGSTSRMASASDLIMAPFGVSTSEHAGAYGANTMARRFGNSSDNDGSLLVPVLDHSLGHEDIWVRSERARKKAARVLEDEAWRPSTWRFGERDRSGARPKSHRSIALSRRNSYPNPLPAGVRTNLRVRLCSGVKHQGCCRGSGNGRLAGGEVSTNRRCTQIPPPERVP